MKPTLIVIEDDYIRADLIAAITVDAAEEDNAANLNVYIIGMEDPISWWFEKWSEAEKAQADATKQWMDAICN